MKVGYARVSSSGQNLESQLEALRAIGCEKIFQEKKSGTQVDNRPQLQEALDFVREGDEFYVTRLDRCSRSVQHLHQIVDTLNTKGVSFRATEQDLDTGSSAGRLMIGLLSIVSAFETDLRAERQADGIKSAQARGVKFGKKRVFDPERVKEAVAMQEQGITNQVIADEYGIGRSTLLRYISEYKKGLVGEAVAVAS
ncbi:MAG TPA: recombinase family protein [Sulfuricurvum sp.]|nr:recombinase family protein [Sulfuricurvum sp.]